MDQAVNHGAFAQGADKDDTRTEPVTLVHDVWHAIGDSVDVCLKVLDGSKDPRIIIRVGVNFCGVLLIDDDESARFLLVST